jgi:hypothetical protein
MNLRRRKSMRARVVDRLRALGPRPGNRTPARITESVCRNVARSGPGKTVQGAGMAGRAAGRGGKALAVYAGRKAAGKRAPLLVSLPVFAGASVASFVAVRKMRQGVKQTVPDP